MPCLAIHRATFAYPAHVLSVYADRGHGLGSFLVEHTIGHPDVASIRQVLLAEPGRSLYRRFGYGGLVKPERWMERPGS